MQGHRRLYVILGTDAIAPLAFGELRETTLGAQSGELTHGRNFKPEFVFTKGKKDSQNYVN